MSTKSLLISVGIVAVLLIASHYFTYKVGYSNGTDDTIATLTQDSTTVTSDTTWNIRDSVVIKYKWARLVFADVDTVNESLVFSTQIDTSVVIAEDTVVVLRQDISFAPSFITDGGGNEWTVYTKDDFKGYFDIITDIQIRPVEKLVEVTKTSFRTVVKEVTVSEFPNTWLTGFISGVISFLIMVLLL